MANPNPLQKGGPGKTLALRRMARLINAELFNDKTKVTPYDLDLLLRTSWVELSLYGHIIHEEHGREKNNDS